MGPYSSEKFPEGVRTGQFKEEGALDGRRASYPLCLGRTSAAKYSSAAQGDAKRRYQK